MTRRKKPRARKEVSSIMFGSFEPKIFESQSEASDAEKLEDEPADRIPAGMSLVEETLANGKFFEESFPQFTVDPTSQVIVHKKNRRVLYAHKLKNRRLVRPELYREVNKGGIFHAGRIEEALILLREVEGLYDWKKEAFKREAASHDGKLRFVDGLKKVKKEGGIVSTINRAMIQICIAAVDGQPHIAERTDFGARGIACLLRPGKQEIERLAGFAGKGDYGVLSAKTGKMVVAIEFKRNPIRGKWMDFKLAQLLFNQGFGFMIGRRCDILILATRGNYMVIWRKQVGTRSGKAVHKYFMYPDREYADFNDEAELDIFMEILGELARISAFAPGQEAPEEGTSDHKDGCTLVFHSGDKLAMDQSDIETDSGEGNLYCCRRRQVIRPTGATTSYAETQSGLIELASMDLSAELTAEQLADLMLMKKPPKDPED